MAWAAGNFTRANGATEWQDDAALGIGIEPGVHDAQDNDLATGIDQCLNKTGQNAMTGNLNVGSNYLVNAARIGVGTASPTTAVHVQSGDQRFFQSGTSSVAAFAASGTAVNLDLVAGQTVYNNNGAAIRLQCSGATDDGAILFSTNLGGTGSAERMRIANTGYVGIGNTSPGVLCDLARSANDTLTRLRLYNANAGASAQTHIDLGNDQNQSAVTLILNSSTNTANAGGNAFHIFNGLSAPIRMRAGGSGGVDLASGGTSWAPVSDQRLKKNIAPLNYGLAQLNQIEAIRFDYIEDDSDDGKRIGFIAQQLQPIVPEAVWGTEDTHFRASSVELIPVLVNAIKELSAKVEALEAQVEMLQPDTVLG